MITNLLIYKILQLFCFMIIGFVISKLKLVRQSDSTVLSRISLYLLMPAAILNAFDFEQSETVRNGLLLAFLAAIAVHIVLYLLDMVYRKFICKHPVERASVMYSNAGNLIIPIVSFVLGDEWVVFSTAFLSVQLFFLFSHGIRLFSTKERINLKKVFLNVNMIVIEIGIIIMLFGWRLPTFVKELTSPLGNVLGAVGMLIAGILAAEIDFKKILKDKRLYRVTLIRTVIYPAIALLVLKLLSLLPFTNSENILLITFLATITPSAAAVMQFAQLNDCDAEYATAINIFTTIVCIVTMPLFVMLYNYL